MHASVTNPAATSAYRPPTLQHTTQTVAAVTRPVSESRAAYDRRASSYDLMTSSAENKAVDAGIAALDAQPGERICEFGFGTGRAVEQFARAVGPEGHVTGIDISPKMRDQALAKVRKAQVDDHVTLRVGDVTDDHDPAVSALQDNERSTFHAVFMSFFLDLIDGPAIPAVVQRAASLLRDGGRLIVVAKARHIERRAVRIYEWAHHHFGNRVDSRPIYPAETIRVSSDLLRVTRVDESSSTFGLPVEVVTAVKNSSRMVPARANASGVLLPPALESASFMAREGPSEARSVATSAPPSSMSTFASVAGDSLFVDRASGSVRPLVARPEWDADDASPVCLGNVHKGGQQRSVTFGPLKRRHHCRVCGKLRCDKCTQHRRLVVGYERDGPVRVCQDCEERISRGTGI